MLLLFLCVFMRETSCCLSVTVIKLMLLRSRYLNDLLNIDFYLKNKM